MLRGKLVVVVTGEWSDTSLPVPPSVAQTLSYSQHCHGGAQPCPPSPPPPPLCWQWGPGLLLALQEGVLQPQAGQDHDARHRPHLSLHVSGQCQEKETFNSTERPVHYRRLAFITVAELLIFHFSISSKTVVLYGSFTQDQSVSKSIIYRVLSLLKGASLIQKLRCWRFIGCPCPCHPRLHTGSSHLCHLATPSQLTKVSHNFFVFDW